MPLVAPRLKVHHLTIHQNQLYHLLYTTHFTFHISHSQSAIMSQGFNISGYPGIASNVTYLSQCTPALCSLNYAVVRYLPNSLANAAFMGLFAIFLIMQIVQWFFYRTHSFTFTMSCGLILEILGYLGRIAMRNQLFVEGPFLMYVSTFSIQ